VHASNIVGMAPTPDGNGYWLIGSDAGCMPSATPNFAESLPGIGVHTGDIVGIATTSDGGGIGCGRRGGVYAFATPASTAQWAAGISTCHGGDGRHRRRLVTGWWPQTGVFAFAMLLHGSGGGTT